MAKAPAAVKRLLVGRPLSSGELHHTLLPKVIALPVFSSDPLSSNAYATQEALIVLAMAGSFGLSLIVPVSIAVATLLVIVVTSYRQTVRAYPTGGGAYRVAHENLGKYPGLLAASALLIDYVLTVSVSVTAGVEAITSAVEGMHDFAVPLAFGFIAFVSLMNLRGVKESGTLFAIPTYGFVASIYLLLAVGLFECLFGVCPKAESAGRIGQLRPETAVGFLLVIRAFAGGTTALTGVEAIADGVPAFRYPQSKNAATTLSIMAVLSISMFLGISWLADQTDVVYTEFPLGQRSVVAQIANAVFGGGPLFYLVQVMSAAILILAANTAYQDFPRLSSILAHDRYMPRQFLNRGDRLVFSNGILILALLSALLIYVFDANLTRLIQLYLVGVFISFTLSQTGMTIRTRKLKPPAWRRTMAISGFGALVTGVVLVVITYSKFPEGAWIVIAAIPVVMFIMHTINAHYATLARDLEHPQRRPIDRRPGHQNFVIYVNKIDAAAARAVGYSRSVRPSTLRAVTSEPAILPEWRKLAPKIPIETLGGRGSTARRLSAYLMEIRRDLGSDDFLTVVVPEILGSRSLVEIVKHPSLHRLKARLVAQREIQVLDIPILREEIHPDVDQSQEPARNHVCVLVAGLHNASLQAIEYGETLRPTTLRAISFGLDPEATEKLGNEWLEDRMTIPLEIHDSPFRDIGASLVEYIRPFEADGVNRVVTVVLPEFIVTKWYHHFLHGKSALVIKRHLLFEPGVVTVSVPYHLDPIGRKAAGPLEGGPVIP